MSKEEMEKQFDGEWVAVHEPDIATNGVFIEGEVVFHSERREDCFDKLEEMASTHCAVVYVGNWPEEREYALNP